MDTEVAGRRIVREGPPAATARREPFPAIEWYDLDLEAQALAIWEASGPGAIDLAREEAVGQAWAQIQPLLDRDRTARAEDVLYGLGAERMAVQPERLARKLLFHWALNRFALWPGDHVRYFSKHAVAGFAGTVPTAAHALLARAQAAGVYSDEVAVFREERAPDPILAVRVGDAWYALYSWL